MPRSVDEIELVEIAVFGLIRQMDCVALNRDTTLTLNVETVENLILVFPLRYNLTMLNQPVCKCRLAVVDMSDYAEISYIVIRHCYSPVE